MKLRLPVEEFTTPNPVTATEDMSIDEVLRSMSEHGVRDLPVVRGSEIVNENDGTLLGIFTVTDALNALIEITRASVRS